MPSFGHTPEALLSRNDSKNPTTTCKGLTASGRPCRRALGGKTRKSIVGGVVALVHEDSKIQEADLYCWQHKDQAQGRIEEKRNQEWTSGTNKRRSLELYTLRERNSIDTFVERLGIHGSVVGSFAPSKTPKNREKEMRLDTRDLPGIGQYGTRGPELSSERPNKTKRSVGGFWAMLCCMTIKEDDYVEIVRHRKRPVHPDQHRSHSSMLKAQGQGIPIRDAILPVRPKQVLASDARQSAGVAYTPAKIHISPSDRHTSHLLSLIPSHLPPQTTSALLAELIKPISPTDEAGYIYIFWLTPQNRAAPAEATARSLLGPTSSRRPQDERRISDVMTDFSYDGHDGHDEHAVAPTTNRQPKQPNSHPDNHQRPRKKRTILLKIGRASNVTRRMNEWQRQCGYALTLVRWYPYVPSSSTSGGRDENSPSSPSPAVASSQNNPSWQDEIHYPDLSHRPSIDRPISLHHQQQQQQQGRSSTGVGGTVRKVPCVKRVERLIHLELAGQQVKQQCEMCGKEHREWFQVEASRTGVRAVDETVKRWVNWAERHGQQL